MNIPGFTKSTRSLEVQHLIEKGKSVYEDDDEEKGRRWQEKSGHSKKESHTPKEKINHARKEESGEKAGKE